jgi:hypothetical protein
MSGNVVPGYNGTDKRDEVLEKVVRKASAVLFLVLVGISVIAASGCTKSGTENGPAVRDTEEARDEAVGYVQGLLGPDPVIWPAPGSSWSVGPSMPEGWQDGTFVNYTAGEWQVRVSYREVDPEKRVYQVTVRSVSMARYWKGTVDAEGLVEELTPLADITEDSSRMLAERCLRNSPTFLYDGIDETVVLKDTDESNLLFRPLCWTFTFEFDSAIDRKSVV